MGRPCANAAHDFWTQIAKFTADAQNDDSKNIRDTLEELRDALTAQMAGMWPRDSEDACQFSDLEKRYQDIRNEILAKRLTGSPDRRPMTCRINASISWRLDDCSR